MKALKYIALGVGSVLGIRYLLSLKQAGEQVVIKVSGQKDKITAQGISILVSYNIQNPTRATVRMTPPLIKLSSAGQFLASSTMQDVQIPEKVKDSNGRIIMKAFSETGDVTATVHIPWLSVLSISPQLMTRLQSSDPKDKITLTVETITHLFTLAGDYPYAEKSSFKL